MLQIDPSPERERLAFKDTVLSTFGFLCDLGFRPVEQEMTYVRYESAEVFVNVYHGRASFELGVELGTLREPNKKLTLYDIVAWAGAEKIEGFGQRVSFQVSSREGVQSFVPKLAALVKKHAKLLLKGDLAAFDTAFEIQSERARSYAKEVNLTSVRAKAEGAWHGKDYAKVAELYGQVRDGLTGVEAKRLAYAEQHVLTVKDRSSSTTRRKP